MFLTQFSGKITASGSYENRHQHYVGWLHVKVSLWSSALGKVEHTCVVRVPKYLDKSFGRLVEDGKFIGVTSKMLGVALETRQDGKPVAWLEYEASDLFIL